MRRWRPKLVTTLVAADTWFDAIQERQHRSIPQSHESTCIFYAPSARFFHTNQAAPSGSSAADSESLEEVSVGERFWLACRPVIRLSSRDNVRC